MPPDAIPAWLRIALEWTFASGGPGDNAFLGVMFALNAGFAAIDSFTKSYMESLRNDFRGLTAKYHDPQWLEAINPDNARTSEEAGRKVQLANMVSEVEMIDAGIPGLFTSTAKKWKSVMGASAAILLLCMAIPYLGRILLLLALPVPLFAQRCRRERDAVYGKASAACRKIDESYRQLVGSSENRSDVEGLAINARLEKIEKTLGDVVALVAGQSVKAASSSPRKTPRRKTASAGF